MDEKRGVSVLLAVLGIVIVSRAACRHVPGARAPARVAPLYQPSAMMVQNGRTAPAGGPRRSITSHSEPPSPFAPPGAAPGIGPGAAPPLNDATASRRSEDPFGEPAPAKAASTRVGGNPFYGDDLASGGSHASARVAVTPAPGAAAGTTPPAASVAGTAPPAASGAGRGAASASAMSAAGGGVFPATAVGPARGPSAQSPSGGPGPAAGGGEFPAISSVKPAGQSGRPSADAAKDADLGSFAGGGGGGSGGGGSVGSGLGRGGGKGFGGGVPNSKPKSSAGKDGVTGGSEAKESDGSSASSHSSGNGSSDSPDPNQDVVTLNLLTGEPQLAGAVPTGQRFRTKPDGPDVVETVLITAGDRKALALSAPLEVSARSETALRYPNGKSLNPKRIPFVVIPEDFPRDVQMGDYVAMSLGGKTLYAIVGDKGEARVIGGSSSALARNLRAGNGVSVSYVFLPGSRDLLPPREAAEIQAKGKALFERAGLIR